MLRRKKKPAVKLARRHSPASGDKPVTLSTFGGSLLALESRMMFDGAAVATVSTVTTEQNAQSQAESSSLVDDGSAADGTPAAPTGEPPATGDQALFDALAALDASADRKEIVFLSPSVLEYQQLLDGISPNVEVYVLDPARDGVEQMAEILAGRTGIDAIHLIGDGTEAEMHLGSSFLTQESISTQYAEQFQQIGQSLSAGADLMIYGCDFGRGEAGQAAIQTLAALTGADVAASTDRTGHVNEYADWQLEVTTGMIESAVVIGESTQADWDHALATFTVTNTNNSGAGSLRTAINSANAAAGADLIRFNIPGAGLNTINLLSALPTITGQVTIDGYTENGASVNTLTTGNNAVLLVELNGAGAGAANGLTLGVGSDGSTIRGLIINRFSQSGIQINSANNLILGNWIGVDATGTLDRGNAVDGITISANNNRIGAQAVFTVADRNVLSGNDDEGVDVDPGVTGIIIQGNYIGTNATGTAGVGNGLVSDAQSGGVRLEGDGTVFGGTAAGQGNLVSGNSNWGVYISGNTNVLYGNFIGTNAAGTAGIANSGPGIWLSGGSNNSIGGTTAGQGNTIAFNSGDGLAVSSTGTGNAILGNSIHSNTGLGIDLNDNGVTANDAGDGDTGSNNLMNFPVIYSVTISGGNVTITGEARPGATVEFFESADAAGTNGEGQTFIGRGTVTSSTGGTVDATARQFSFTFAAGSVVAGDRVTATATDAGNNTSEFGVNATAFVNTAPVLDNTKSPALTAINEDAGAPSGAVGTLVSNLVDFAVPAGQVDNVTDPNAGALLGIAITAADTTNGTWFYSTNNGASWNALGAVANNSARLLAADANTRIYFQPNADYNGTIANAITFRAWDRTSGINGGTADTSTNGGNTAFSTATDTASLVVTAINDAPVLATGSTLAYTENGAAVAINTLITVADVDNATLSTGTVVITGNFASGEDVLSFTNVPATMGNITGTYNPATGVMNLSSAGNTATLAQWQVALRAVQYSNSSDNPSTLARTVSYTVNDSAANSNTVTATVTITAVNDVPVITSNGGGASASISVTENTTAVTDVDATDVEAPPQTLTYSIVPVGAGGAADAARFTITSSTGVLTFVSAPDFESPTDANLDNVYDVTVQVSDGNGGTGTQVISVAVLNNPGSLVVDTAADYASGNANYGDTSSIAALLANKGADNLISLREALDAANNTANDGGPDQINFAIAGVGPRTISLTAALPFITDSVILNATTQSGYVIGTPVIWLDGAAAGAEASGFVLRASNSTITGFRIQNFVNGTTSTTGTGIVIDGTTGGGDNNTISQNYLTNNSESVTGTVGAISIAGAADNNVITNNQLVNNNSDGIRFADTLSTGTQITNNVITGSGDDGVKLVGANIIFTGNTVSNSQRLTANAAGVEVETVTGASVVSNNTITNDGTRGIEGGIWIKSSTGLAVGNNTVTGWSGSGIAIDNASSGIHLTQNSIVSNSLLGIDLNADGLTANDAGDSDAGANNLQNFPVLTSVQVLSSTQVAIVGSLNSTANSQFRIEFFGSSAQDPSGHGEGQTYLGFVDVTTDGSGNASFNTTLSATVSAGSFITTTATRSNATFTTFTDASEFGQNVVATNNAPVLDASKSPALTAINEDAGAPSGAVGTPVSQFVDFASPSGQVDNVTDPDGGALLGIAVTAADTTNGTWFYSTNNGANWNALGAVSAANARLLAADANTRIYFQPNANYNGTLPNAITFRAWDRTSGSNGALADTSTNGGMTAFSSATDTASLVVNAQNDAPTITAIADQTINEDGTTGPLGFSVSDVETAAGSLTVTAVSSNTTLIPNGNLTLVDLTGGNWTIAAAPAPNQSGGPVTITVTVSDGTTTTTETFDVTVLAQNDAPTLAANTGSTVVRGGTDVITTAELQVTDVDNTPGQLTYTVTVGPVNGQLELTTAPGVAINSFTQAQINSGQVVYVHNGSFTASDSFTFTASDGAGGNIGATTFGITVTSVNSAPTLAANAGSTVVQGLTDLITSGELQVTDADNAPAQLVYTVTTIPVNGRLELTTAPGVAVTSFTQADIDAGRLVFVHSGAASTTDSFTFTVSDGAGGAIGATTFTFTVAPFFPPPGGGGTGGTGGGSGTGSGGGTGSGSGSGTGTGSGSGSTGSVVPPPFVPPSVLIGALPTKEVLVVGATKDPVPRAVLPSRTFARVEQPDIVLEKPSVLPVEPLSLPVKKMLAVGHKLAERLTRLADDLERGVQEREHKAHLIGRVTSFSGMALSAGFVAWLLRGGSLMASFLVSMPAWRHFDPLPVLGASGRDRRKRDRDMREEHEQENKQFRGLDRVLKSSVKPAKQRETGRAKRPKS